MGSEMYIRGRVSRKSMVVGSLGAASPPLTPAAVGSVVCVVWGVGGAQSRRSITTTTTDSSGSVACVLCGVGVSLIHI